MDEKRTALPTLAAVAGLVSVHFGAAFAKSLFPRVGPEGVAALRIGISAILLAATFRPWTIRVDARAWASLAGYGVVLGLMNVLIYHAFGYLPLGIAISIETVGPLGVALATSRRRLDLLWIALAALGLALLPLGSISGTLDPRGVAFALAAATCWGLYVVFGAKVAEVGLGGRGVAAGMAVATMVVGPIGLDRAGAELFRPPVLAAGAVVAVLSSAVPFLLDIYALKRLPSRVFGVLMSASPAIGALAGRLILGEALGAVQWLGVAAITAACAGCALAAREGPAGGRDAEAAPGASAVDGARRRP